MSFNPLRAANLLKLLSFPRLAGTEGEVRAREIIVGELKSYGYEPGLEEFELKVFEVEEASLEVLEPWKEQVECSGVGFSGSTPPEGVEAEFKYVETGDRALLPSREGLILLASRRPDLELYKNLMKVKPAGIVVAESSPYRRLSHVGVMSEWRRHGSAPMVYVRFEDAYRMVECGARRVRLKLLQREWITKSCNIVVEKKGLKYPEEEVVVCAHYDSVYGVPGATDNAGGTAFLLELARVFSSKSVKRTLRFIAFSGEELGLRGSLAHVERRKATLENVKMVVNLDVHGGSVGFNRAVVTGPPQVRQYLEVMAKKLGYNLAVSEDVYSSDSSSFAKAGVPAVSFSRSSGASAGIHSLDDDGRFTGTAGYATIGPLVVEFIELLVNSEEFPFPREIPEELRKKVDEYFTKRLGIEESGEEN